MASLRLRRAAIALGIVAYMLTSGAAPALAAVIDPPTLQFALSRTDGINPTVNWSNNTAGTGDGPVYDYSHDVSTANWKFQWSVSADPDPILTSNLSITNNTIATQTFTSTVTLPIANINPSTLRGGSVGGSVTDGNGNGATLSTVTGSALYSAQVNLVTAHTLHNDPFSVSFLPPFATQSIPSADFGSPIPSLVSGPALNSISIQLKFTLSPGDSAVISSVFVVEPVPEPTGLLLIGLMGGLTLFRRRRHMK